MPRASRPPPVWLEIRRYLQELLATPGYGPGDYIQSERTLSEALGANRMTVRKAIDSLVAAGVLERNSTSGTRIPLPRVTRPADGHTALGIARLVRAGGGEPANRLLDFARHAAPARIAERLGVAEGAELAVIRRLWMVNESPFCIETTHLPGDRVPGLCAEDLTEGQSLYALLRERYGLTTTQHQRTIGIGYATEAEARLLNLTPGTAILLLRLLVDDGAGKPIEYTTSVNHPQLVVFRAGPDGG
ncbi:MAG: GntR family transcriptional regulator [Alphaproteobacteria bacterium]|nr:GntR family transcriptional regulator [Alphaproteobacteria bacterium]